jgi:hypothetical protein
VAPVVLIIAVVYVTYIIANSPQTSELAFASHLCLALTLTIHIGTTLSVVSNFLVEWEGAIKDILRFAHFLVMPVHLFGLQCTIGNNFVLSFLYVSLLPMLPVLLLGAGMFLCRRRCHQWKAVNAGGQIFYGCFVFIVLHSMKPVILYGHPSGHYSMTHSPQTLTNTARHTQLLFIGGTQMIVYCCGYLSLCGYAVWRLRALRRSGAARVPDLMMRYRFLFFRFKAKYYYWGMVFLMRSALISLVTVVKPDLPHVQIILMVILLSVFLSLHCVTWPCRTWSHNLADALVQGFLLCFVSSCGAYRSSTTVKAGAFISHVLIVMFFGFFCIIATVLLLPVVRLVRSWQSAEKGQAQTGIEPKTIAEELLKKPCDAVLEVPLPSHLLDRREGTCTTEQMVVAEIGIARVSSKSCVGWSSESVDGSIQTSVSSYSNPSSSSQMNTLPSSQMSIPQYQTQGAPSIPENGLLESIPANVKLNIGGTGGVDTLSVAFSSQSFAWREPMLRQILEHEHQMFEMSRAVMTAMLDGLLSLKCQADGNFSIEWSDEKST